MKSQNWFNKIKFNKIKNINKQDSILNVKSEVLSELKKIDLKSRIKPKDKIGITSGSRGICNITTITKCIVDYIYDCGGIPYIIPSMGSHGGATAEGQVKMLSNLGISEETMNCEILASMEVTSLGKTKSGYIAYTDKLAFELDGIFVVNRVKPHTDFDSDIESGIVKMVAVGMGNQIGCNHIHSLGLSDGVKEVGEFLIDKLNILGGLGIVENSLDQTYLVKGVLKEDFILEDKKMLELSKKLVPKLPVRNIDVLIVKEIGKTYSGTGMDTKVIGRIKIDSVLNPQYPKVRMITALGLSDASDGNALGVGLADIISKKLYDKIDLEKTYANVLSTTYLERGKIPIIRSDDKEAISSALATIGDKEDFEKRIVVIDNTLHLDTMLISDNISVDEISSSGYEVIESDILLSFDDLNNLSTYF